MTKENTNYLEHHCWSLEAWINWCTSLGLSLSSKYANCHQYYLYYIFNKPSLTDFKAQMTSEAYLKAIEVGEDK